MVAAGTALETALRQLESKEAGPATDRIRALASALTEQRTIEDLAARRRLIAPSAPDVKNVGLDPAITSRLKRGLARIPIKVAVTGEAGDEIRTCLAEAMTGLGLTTTARVDSDLTLRGDITTKLAGRHEGAAIYKTSIVLELEDTRSGRDLGTWSESFKNMREDPQTAAGAAATSLCANAIPRMTSLVASALGVKPRSGSER